MQRISNIPTGLVYQPNFLSAAEERELLLYVKALHLHDVVMHGQVAKRTVRHFGVGYNFTTRQTTTGPVLPPALDWLIARAEALAGLSKGSLAEALITKYPVGAGIGWHSDAEAFGLIIGVSLATPCVMRFRLGDVSERLKYERIINPRSAYVMSGEARQRWEHHIPAAKSERYSITLRTLVGGPAPGAAAQPGPKQ